MASKGPNGGATMSRMPEELRQQLPEALKAAEIAGIETADVDENVRLWGPPGTGKSTQSLLRTATRALEDGLWAQDMTVVTYRKSLAEDVRGRMQEWGVFEGDEGFDYWTTIHAAASRATDFHERFDRDRDALEGMVGAPAEYRFCSDLGISRNPSRPWFETRWTVFRDLYDYAKSNLLSAGQYTNVPDSALRDLESDVVAHKKLQAFHDEWGERADFQEIAQKWEEFKDYHNCFDFYEQLTEALTGPLPPMQHVVIDEYHDATPLMAAVTERWVKAADTAIVAGDPDQVVNAYAGADPVFFEQLEERTSVGLPIVKLDRSWRCPDEHFAAARDVLVKERQPPELETDGPGKLNRWGSPDFQTDGDGSWVTFPQPEEPGSPAWLWEEFGDDIIYLLRTQKQADGVARSLDEAGIVYRSQSSVGGDWERRLALLNALDLLKDITPPSKPAPSGTATLASGGGSDLRNYALSREQARLLREHSHGHYLVDDSGWDTYFGGLDDGETVPLDAWNEYVSEKWWLRYTNGPSSLHELVGLTDRDEVALSAGAARNELPMEIEDTDARVLTIHASKGTEASNVVIFDGITGGVRDGMENSDLLRENEARTWYVALTRASERLHIIRDAFEYAEPYLPEDLEPRAAADAKRMRGVGE